MGWDEIPRGSRGTLDTTEWLHAEPPPVFELSITPLTNFPLLWSTARLNAATNKVLAKPCASTSGETSPSAEGKETWKAKLVPFQERACLFPKSVSLRGEKNKSPTQD